MKLLKVAHNFWIDYCIQRTFLGGRIESIDGREMIYDSVSTGYDHVNLIFFKYYSIKPEDVIAEVGCGKGRVINYLLYKGIKNKMIGYEINIPLAKLTQKRLRRYKNVEIKCENIFDEFPNEANLFYLFNPFKTGMMEQFKEKIWEIKSNNPIMLYYNPTCLEVFNDPRFTYKVIDVPIPFFGFNYQLAMISLK